MKTHCIVRSLAAALGSRPPAAAAAQQQPQPLSVLSRDMRLLLQYRDWAQSCCSSTRRNSEGRSSSTSFPTRPSHLAPLSLPHGRGSSSSSNSSSSSCRSSSSRNAPAFRCLMTSSSRSVTCSSRRNMSSSNKSRGMSSSGPNLSSSLSKEFRSSSTCFLPRERLHSPSSRISGGLSFPWGATSSNSSTFRGTVLRAVAAGGACGVGVEQQRQQKTANTSAAARAAGCIREGSSPVAVFQQQQQNNAAVVAVGSPTVQGRALAAAAAASGFRFFAAAAFLSTAAAAGRGGRGGGGSAAAAAGGDGQQHGRSEEKEAADRRSFDAYVKATVERERAAEAGETPAETAAAEAAAEAAAAAVGKQEGGTAAERRKPGEDVRGVRTDERRGTKRMEAAGSSRPVRRAAAADEETSADVQWQEEEARRAYAAHTQKTIESERASEAHELGEEARRHKAERAAAAAAEAELQKQRSRDSAAATGAGAEKGEEIFDGKRRSPSTEEPEARQTSSGLFAQGREERVKTATADEFRDCEMLFSKPNTQKKLLPCDASQRLFSSFAAVAAVRPALPSLAAAAALLPRRALLCSAAAAAKDPSAASAAAAATERRETKAAAAAAFAETEKEESDGEQETHVTVGPRPVYFDYQATTVIDPRVMDAMLPFMYDLFGNPHSSSHALGWEASAAVEKARQQVARLLGLKEAKRAREIIFTSGATESNNLAIKGAVRYYCRRGNPVRFNKNAAPAAAAAAPRRTAAAAATRGDREEGRSSDAHNTAEVSSAQASRRLPPPPPAVDAAAAAEDAAAVAAALEDAAAAGRVAGGERAAVGREEKRDEEMIWYQARERSHIITTQLEHKCALQCCRMLQAQYKETGGKAGCEVTFLPVDREGLVDVKTLEAAIRPSTLLVSVMHVNNEIGVMQNLEAIGKLCAQKDVLFHTDAAQSVGKVPVDVDGWKIDLLSLSGHKIYGPKGIGALFIRAKKPRVRLLPLIDGGGQERGLRSGTLPTALCVGLGAACEVAGREMKNDERHIKSLARLLLKNVKEQIPYVEVNGSITQRYMGNWNISFTFVEGESLIMSFKNVAVSSGSACTSASLEPSYVLRALGVGEEVAHTSLRFGLGRFSTERDVEMCVETLAREVKRLREMSPLYELEIAKRKAQESGVCPNDETDSAATLIWT